MLNSLQIKFFLKVAQNLNISKTARDNYISQPAVSKHIKNLEDELGVTLFKRVYHTLCLTEEGRIYYQLFHRFFNEFEQVSQQLNDHFFELESDIHLGILSAWDICTSVYETIQSFTTKYPKIHISINSYSFKSLLSNLHCGKLDVIVYIKSCLEREANIVIYPLGQIHRLFAYSPQNPLCFKKNLTALDFKDETFLYHIDDGLDLSNDLLMDTCKRCGFTPATFKVVPNTESMLLEAQEGLGIALVNCMVHTHNLKRFVLTPTSVICMAIRKGDNNPIIRAFINEVLFQQANSPNPEKVYPYIMHKQHPASPASNITTRE